MSLFHVWDQLTKSLRRFWQFHVDITHQTTVPLNKQTTDLLSYWCRCIFISICCYSQPLESLSIYIDNASCTLRHYCNIVLACSLLSQSFHLFHCEIAMLEPSLISYFYSKLLPTKWLPDLTAPHGNHFFEVVYSKVYNITTTRTTELQIWMALVALVSFV